MNQSQINRLESLVATETYLDNTTATWSPIVIVTRYKNELSQLITTIRSTAQDQEAAQVFIGKSVTELKYLIAEKMDILDDTLEAYAEDQGMEELRIRADNSKSDYLRLPHEDFETKVKNMIDLISTHVEAMADYGMSTEQTDEVKETFGVFQDRRGKPRSYQIASKVATSDIAELFKLVTVVMEKLDRVMKRFKRSNASFYTGYLAARAIVNN